MKKVLHIFTKDIRHLWPEIMAIIALWVFAIWLAPDLWLPWDRQGEVARFGGAYLPLLLAFSWCFLIVRVIQEDKLVGNRQFWVTRPYGWKSLLVAKLLFIVLFFNLPMLISDSVLLSRAGFRPADYVLGLIWKQLLLTIVLALPAMVIATLTTNFAQAALAGLVSCVVAIALVSLSTVLPLASGLYALDWIRTCFELLIGAFACIATLLWQYSRRERALGLKLLVAGIALVAVVHIAMPWTAMISHQYAHSGASPGFSSFQLNYDADPELYVHQTKQSGVPGSVRLQIPVLVSGLPEGYAIVGDAVKVSIEVADHHTWHSRWQNSMMTVSSSVSHAYVDFTVSDSLFEQAKGDPVNLRLTLALTLLKESATTVVATEQPFRVPGVGICAVSGRLQNSSIFCRSPLRQPYQYFISYDWANSLCFSTPGNVDVLRSKIQPGRDWFSNKDPLPAELAIIPIIDFSLGGMSGSYSGLDDNVRRDVSYSVCPGVHVTFGTHEAVARTRRELEISNLRLTDYQIKSSQ
jgi:hypothetical protein